jgi:DNA-directed RNA polymerase subunit RPC12/RpoP
MVFIDMEDLKNKFENTYLCINCEIEYQDSMYVDRYLNWKDKWQCVMCKSRIINENKNKKTKKYYKKENAILMRLNELSEQDALKALLMLDGK